jgi:hypothetical protein
MLFLATYQIDLENLETAMAKRLELEEVAPESMKMICEYSVHGRTAPLSGFFVFESDDVDVLNFLIIYFGKTVHLDIRPCSDVLNAIKLTRKNLGEG